ncbi:MAG TPA: hypothetical protein EYH02_01485 [Ignisphaera aggregans]|uniref:Uncharacterized protein n=1 Tax=Ignisphaera aggregans TaxID=334771 RepID=A0A833DTC6_9CREN|nr:hypothetical protein [Ignisphaera aggregans]
MRIAELRDEISKTVFSLHRSGFSTAARRLIRACSLLDKLDPSRALEPSAQASLRELLSMIRKCSNEDMCSEIASKIYRIVMFIYLESTGKMRCVVRARKLFYLGASLGLPLVALYGTGPLPIMVMFFTLIVTYFQVVKLTRLGLAAVYTISTLILFFDALTLRYSLYALSTPKEITEVARALGVGSEVAIAITILLLLIASISTLCLLYTITTFIRLREVLL